MANEVYTASYYESLCDGSRRSAKVIVPMVLQLVRPRSVVDVGCGQGVWLSAFQELGVSEVLGIDGDHVDRGRLLVSKESFVAQDLCAPLKITTRFDLVVSLEVAEHLPASCADTFVETLTNLGQVVLFSAAIPFQGGHCHVNEQWPEYWAERFQQRGYLPVDCLRYRLLARDDVDWWYAQNILLYVHASVFKENDLLRCERARFPAAVPLVHPRRYLHFVAAALGNSRP